MKFTKTSKNYDPVVTYTSEDGLVRITKRPSQNYWEVKVCSLFDILGEVIGQYETLEEAIASVC